MTVRYVTAGLTERKAMAAAFARLPVRVLWRLSDSEVPDQAALAELNVGNNTKVRVGEILGLYPTC